MGKQGNGKSKWKLLCHLPKTKNGTVFIHTGDHNEY